MRGMTKSRGILFASSPEGVVEQETYTCGHCNRVSLLAHGERGEDVGMLCKQCMTLICPACGAAGSCTPWEKQMERQEARYRALKSYGLAE